MNSSSWRRTILPGAPALTLALILGLALSACGAANESSTATGGTGSAGGSLSGTLNGAGSTAQQAAQQAWTAAFQSANSGATVNYNPTGSGAGVQSFTQGAVQFAGSDAALDPTQGQVAAASNRCGAPVIEVPDYVSPIAVVYNLPGVASLKLDPSTLAGIFDGAITTWNDPAIAKLNPGASLPGTTITPVHRSDPSGTTDNFTDYLNKASHGTWKWAANEVWPVKSGEGANGTSGVISAIKNGAGSIGYADNSQVGSLSTAEIKVGTTWTKPSATGASIGLGASPLATGRAKTDLVVNIDRTTTQKGAYPLMLVSYLIACPTYPSSQASLVKGYLSQILSSSGQQEAAKSAGSAPLPSSLESKAAALVGSIKAK